MEARVTTLEQGFDDLKGVLHRLEPLLSRMDGRLSHIENRLGHMDDRLGHIDDRLGRVEDQLGRVDDRLRKVEIETFPKLSVEIAELRGRVTQLPTAIQLVGFILAVLVIAGLTKVFST